MLKTRSLLLPFSKMTNYIRSYSSSPIPEDKKVKVGKHNINYIKVGNGPQTVLLWPGALGTIWTDFKPQVEGFDREKFTIIALDPPGYGKSRPPEREYPTDFYFRDAEASFEFMKALNIPKYSVLGWSDGGVVGLIKAAKYPEAVEKLVIWGSNSFLLPTDVESIEHTRDVSKWSERMRKPMIEIYGAEYFAKLWAAFADGIQNMATAEKGNICAHLLKDIKCPTLILHGEKDPMLDGSHVSHLHTNISTSRIHLYPDGKHNIHLRYAEDFNKRVQEFLLQPSSSL